MISVANERLSNLSGRQLLLLSLLLGLFGAFFVGVGLNEAPDIFTDEILYTRAGIRVASEGALVWDSGRPLVIHPPLYFLVEGAFLKLTAETSHLTYVPGDIFAAVYYVRWLNVIFAGLTTALFFWLGYRLHNWQLGLLLVALFIIDPFGLRINRRAMLETLAGLLLLAGMGLMLSGRAKEKQLQPLSWSRAILAGLLLGGAMLTKDLAFTAILVVFLFGLWEGWCARRQERPARRWLAPYLLSAAVAGLSYGIVPLWALLAGHWDRFYRVKILALRRLVGLVQLSGWNRPGVSIVDFLLERLIDYGSSYLLLALGGISVILLLIFWLRSANGRFLALWGLVLYPFYGFVAVVGSGNDQFFYLLLLPAIVLVGSTLATLSIALADYSHLKWVTVQKAIIIILLLGLLPFNLFSWFSNYVLESDNGYHQLASFVEQNVPPGVPLNASGDALKYIYFFPDRPISNAGTPAEAIDERVHYLVLAPKDVRARYGRVTPELALWLAVNGQLIFQTEGDSYGEIYLYRVAYGSPSAAPEVTERVFDPAEGADITPLLIMLGGWFGLWALVAGVFYRRDRFSRARSE